jgi:hypothetical protein
MLSEPTPRAIDLGSGVECMGTKTLIGFSDIFMALFADAGHLVDLPQGLVPLPYTVGRSREGSILWLYPF